MPFPAAAGARNTSFSYNRKVVAEANASDTVFDVVFYGDSLTGLLVQIEDNEAVFNTFFNSATTPWKTARLGVGGSTVEELTWRILVNGEKLAQDPLVSWQAEWGGEEEMHSCCLQRRQQVLRKADCMIMQARVRRSSSCSSASTTR